MELLRLRRRIVVARRGHKLLKDKQDELMRQFLALVEEIKGLREEVESSLRLAHQRFVIARGVMSDASLEEAIMYPKSEVELEVASSRVMNVAVPEMKAKWRGDVYSYGYVGTSGELDAALGLYSKVLPQMIKLAQIEKSMEMLAAEIEKTRRRVNALEYILIPNLLDTAKYITMKLEEMERGNITRLMKIKSAMR